MRVSGTGEERGRTETSSFDPAEGRTSLMRSSFANRRSLSLRWAAMAPEGVSVDSDARTRTGVGVAPLAVLGLNRSYSVSRSSCCYKVGNVQSLSR